MAPARLFVITWVAATALFGGPLAAAELRLTVDWAGVASLSQPFPVSSGIPFARGALSRADSVRLLSNRGDELPLQTEAMAFWPDGTVKWLLLDFQATPRDQVLWLQYGKGVRETIPKGGIRLSDTADEIAVDTGPLQFTVRRRGSGFLDRLSFEGKEVFSRTTERLSFFDFLHVDDPAGVAPMDRYVDAGRDDPSRLAVDSIVLEKAGPLHAVVRIDGRYCYHLVGSTISGTRIKGDCPFRLRIHAYAGQSLLRIEHFFYYEGDGDHDFGIALGLKLPLPGGVTRVRYLGAQAAEPAAPISGLYQQDANRFVIWQSSGKDSVVSAEGDRFEGVLDAAGGQMGVMVGIKDLWQNAAKGLRADLKARELGVYFWPPEACPLDFRRQAREWSVGETGAPDDPAGTTPRKLTRPNYRLASKGVGKTHYALVYCHRADSDPHQLLSVYQLFNHRPLLWAAPQHYAATLALGRYCARVPGEHDDIEAVLDSGPELWRASRDRFGWYGFWLYGNVCQDYNGYLPNGRWSEEFGRWGWANGDSAGRLAYALMLQAVRKCTRADFEFGEGYLHNVHDVCSTHTPAYPYHYSENFAYLKGAAHRHGAWPWACLYVGARGAHPVGAKIYYFLTGEGHAKDILDEITQLALKNPDGGEGDGPAGPNAQIYLYQWETTGDAVWRQRLETELHQTELLRTANDSWSCMMCAAFGIKDALDEYMELSGDYTLRRVASDFADRCLPEKIGRDWTHNAYFRVYASAYDMSGNEKYRMAIRESLAVLRDDAGRSLAFKVPRPEWPGPAGGPRPLIDGNLIRDVPFALYALHLHDAVRSAKEGRNATHAR